MILLALLPLSSDPYVEKVPPTRSWKVGSGKTEMELSADGSTVATLDPVSGKVTTWNVNTGGSIATLGTDKGGQYPAVSADGKMVAVQGKDGKLHVWPGGKALDLSTQSPNYEFASSGHMLVFTTANGLSAYDPDLGKTVASARFRLPDRFILQVRTKPVKVVLGDTSEEDSGFYMWDCVAGHKVTHAPLGRQVTRFISPSTDHTLIYQGIAFDPSSGLSALIYQYDLSTGKSKQIFSLDAGRNMLSFLYFEPMGRQICDMHFPGDPWQVLVRMPGSKAKPYFVADDAKRFGVETDAAGKVIATIGEDGIVRVWRLV